MSAWLEQLHHPDNEMRMRAAPEMLARLGKRTRLFYSDPERYVTQAAAQVLINDLRRRRGNSAARSG